jgi:hypothetical protein
LQMAAQNDDGNPRPAFIAVLGDFERLSAHLSVLIKAHGDPQNADILFAVTRAKDAADHAVRLLRHKVRGPQ